ncbi:hypothetical protein HanIR_Chr17g0861371 [Helianthus annuus]|nr:hypothetical protein HanIR_Chr17g0861371 [Helianthus annuus]
MPVLENDAPSEDDRDEVFKFSFGRRWRVNSVARNGLQIVDVYNGVIYVRDDIDRDSQSKRPKVHSLALDCDSFLLSDSFQESRLFSVTEKEYECLAPDEYESSFMSDSWRMKDDENVSPEIEDLEVKLMDEKVEMAVADG